MNSKAYTVAFANPPFFWDTLYFHSNCLKIPHEVYLNKIKNVSAPLQNYHSSFARFRKYSEMQVKYPTHAVVGTIFIGAA